MNLKETFALIKQAEEAKKNLEITMLIEFGSNVQRIRNTKGMKQEDLAELVQIGRTSITNIEAGRQDTTISKFMLLCMALECEANDLIPKMDI